ncbi:MAG: RNA polymerase sigma factor [Deltaproteobacteria bacterium]|nr:RNA polymerase sigma factor [Deltaproteobacteria bacterium]
MQAPDCAALLARCQQRDERAWKELFEAHFAFAYGVARRLGTPPGEVEDVCQEAFVVVFRKIGDFQHGRFSTWLYRIVANVVSDRHRRRRFREAMRSLAESVLPASLAPAPTPEAALQQRDAETAVNRVLERMAPKKREVFALYELESLSGEEIAERVGCKLETVWTRLHYARKEFTLIAEQLGIAVERSA